MGTETQFWFQRPWDKIYKNDSPKIFFKKHFGKKKRKKKYFNSFANLSFSQTKKPILCIAITSSGSLSEHPLH